MSKQDERTYPGMVERTPHYWQGLVTQMEGLVGSFESQLKQVFGTDVWQIDFKCSASASISPRIRGAGRRIQIEFPEGFFVWMDEAAMFMHGDVPYRNALAICRARPETDHSRIFHLLWGLWIAYHELSHFLCGHLSYLSAAEFVELDALPSPSTTQDQRFLREAMEVDADVLAAKLFFGHIGRVSEKGYWDDLYGLEDAGLFVMQDLALIFLPLFMEISHMSAEGSARRTHPIASHRLILFNLFGLNAYRKEVAANAEEYQKAYMAGLKKAMELLIHMPESMLRKGIEEPEFVSHKEALLGAGMDKMRLVRIEGDWLSR